ncbi:MAG TPA: hypothetical protein VL633_10460 [Bacteroidota bacterium]|jgi:hypothetical protein|nr:hypothetical protein [Bacteroidota bacterium]
MLINIFPGTRDAGGQKFALCSLTALILVAAMSLCVIGCSKDSVVTAPSGSSSIEGYVTDGSGLQKGTAGIAAATITVGRMQSDGSLSVVSTSAVQTDVNGHYLVEVNAVNERNLVVVATKGTMELKAAVAAEVRANTIVQAPPMTVQSTVEADVLAQIAADGNPDFVTISDLRTYIDASIASNVQGNSSAIVSLARAISAEAQARAHALASAEIAATQDQIAAARNASVQAAAELDASLSAHRDDPSGSRAALEVFYQATINAYVNNGIGIEKFSRMQVASLRAMLQWSSQLSTGTRFLLEQRAAHVRALLMDRVSQIEFQALGAGQSTVSAVVSAGVTLQTSITTATTSQQIAQSFSAYHDAIVQAMEGALPTYAGAIATVDGNITKNNGYKAQLVASIQAAITPQDVVQAFWSYDTQIKTAVTNALAGATSVQIQAVSTLLVMVNMY